MSSSAASNSNKRARGTDARFDLRPVRHMIKRVHFGQHTLLAFGLLAPQLLILGVFVFMPAAQALVQSTMMSDPFGQHWRFVGLENFKAVLQSPEYLNSIWRTVIFSSATTFLSVASGLVLAVFVDRVIRGYTAYKLLVIWPYAVAPVIAGVLWLFLFHPIYGAIAFTLRQGLGISWNPLLNGTDAMILVTLAAAWKQISYNFVFFLAALSAIPKSLIEAAAIDGAGPVRRLFGIILPLISPVTFFLLVVNIVYAFFDTFGIIHALTQGGPGGATDIMVYRVYAAGFVGQDLGSSSAQSVILMIIVIALTFIQFRYVERKVKYAS